MPTVSYITYSLVSITFFVTHSQSIVFLHFIFCHSLFSNPSHSFLFTFNLLYTFLSIISLINFYSSHGISYLVLTNYCYHPKGFSLYFLYNLGIVGTAFIDLAVHLWFISLIVCLFPFHELTFLVLMVWFPLSFILWKDIPLGHLTPFIMGGSWLLYAWWCFCFKSFISRHREGAAWLFL